LATEVCMDPTMCPGPFALHDGPVNGSPAPPNGFGEV